MLLKRLGFSINFGWAKTSRNCWFFSLELTKLHSSCPLNPFQAKWNVKIWKFSIFFSKRAKECWSLVENFPTEFKCALYLSMRTFFLEDFFRFWNKQILAFHLFFSSGVVKTVLYVTVKFQNNPFFENFDKWFIL